MSEEFQDYESPQTLPYVPYTSPPLQSPDAPSTEPATSEPSFLPSISLPTRKKSRRGLWITLSAIVFLLLASLASLLLVVPIAPGTITGKWTVPESQFVVQGTSISLSTRTTSQHNTISRVQFTATSSGQTPLPICDITVPNGNIYTCLWNLKLHGAYLHNGPITFGFTIIAIHSGPLVNPDGTRTGIVRYVKTQPSDIYAGYAAVDLNQFIQYKNVTTRWTVPQAHCSPGENSDSAIWAGMTGISENSKLAQLGTESACRSGFPQYFAWWEVFPDPFVPISETVKPGDSVTANVIFQNGQFQLLINDSRQGWHFSITQAGTASDTVVAECIAEAPTILTGPNTNQGYIAQLTDFATVSIFCQVNDGPIGNGPQNVLYQMGTSSVKATTSSLDPAGSIFTVQWNHH